jgi:hypothetical protein
LEKRLRHSPVLPNQSDPTGHLVVGSPTFRERAAAPAQGRTGCKGFPRINIVHAARYARSDRCQLSLESGRLRSGCVPLLRNCSSVDNAVDNPVENCRSDRVREPDRDSSGFPHPLAGTNKYRESRVAQLAAWEFFSGDADVLPLVDKSLGSSRFVSLGRLEGPAWLVATIRLPQP